MKTFFINQLKIRVITKVTINVEIDKIDIKKLKTSKKLLQLIKFIQL